VKSKFNQFQARTETKFCLLSTNCRIRPDDAISLQVNYGAKMHDLEVIKKACTDALQNDESNPEVIAQFHEVVDPASVLELVHVLESSITAHELETLTRLIRDLTDYVEAVPDEANRSTHLDRDQLIRYARHLYGVFAR
jgi:hypothetical protein